MQTNHGGEWFAWVCLKPQERGWFPVQDVRKARASLEFAGGLWKELCGLKTGTSQHVRWWREFAFLFLDASPSGSKSSRSMRAEFQVGVGRIRTIRRGSTQRNRIGHGNEMMLKLFQGE